LATEAGLWGRPSPFGYAADLLDPPYNWLDDPAGWVKTELGEYLWSKQIEILEALRDNRHVAVHSCHESGKSFVAARAVCWWIGAHAPGDAFAVTTAPTEAQVKAILWREINRAHAKAQLPGRTNQKEWWIGKEIVGMGRKPSEYDAEAFQGIHAPYVLVVIDEANAVPRGLYDAAETLIANESGRMLAIGNPDDPSSYFAEICKPGSGWAVIHIAADMTPLFSGEYVPEKVAMQMISPLWAEERRVRWGEDSPLYIAKVKGEFPPYASDTTIPWHWLAKCRTEEVAYSPTPTDEVHLGIDVGAGGDETVMWVRTGLRADAYYTDHSADPENVVNLAMRVIKDHKVNVVKIDTIGIGWGVAGWLEKDVKELDWAVDVLKVNVAEVPSDREHFVNLRDEVWWMGRELSRTQDWDLRAVPDDTIAQLIAPKYGLQKGGRVKVEPKDEVKKRLGRSPDEADALLLCYFNPPREIWTAV
jgi:hypothetical protein